MNAAGSGPLPRVVEAGELATALPMERAIDALDGAFHDDGPGAMPLRSRVETAAGTLLTMPAAGERGVGVKLVSLTPGNPDRGAPFLHAVYVLFDPVTQAPEATIEGSTLTALRTAAVSGVATRCLARPDARRLVIFGAGTQARAHLDAMLAVRPVDDVVVISRSSGPAEELVAVAEASGRAGRLGDPGAVASADIVCTCTTSPAPLFDGRLLSPGTHVNAIGAYTPETREVDSATVRRARVVVETREAALAESGDLLLPIREGVVGPEHVAADLFEVVRGHASVRRSADDVTLFVSVGIAFEDLAIARAAMDAIA